MSGRMILCAIFFLTSAVAADDEVGFTDITLQAGTGGPTERGRLDGHGAMFADVNDDGRADLYITMIFNTLRDRTRGSGGVLTGRECPIWRQGRLPGAIRTGSWLKAKLPGVRGCVKGG